jgi:DNA repair exonuclease SbcCD ATPase subunit
LEDIFAQIGRAQTFQNAKRNSADKPKKSTKTNPIILKKKLQEIENKNSDLEKLEEELISLQSEFYDPNIYNRPQKLKKINSEIKNIKDNINRLREEIDILEEDYLQKV